MSETFAHDPADLRWSERGVGCWAGFPRCGWASSLACATSLRRHWRSTRRIETGVEVNRGGPGNALSDEELARKFHDNAVRSLPGGARGRDHGPNARPSW